MSFLVRSRLVRPAYRALATTSARRAELPDEPKLGSQEREINVDGNAGPPDLPQKQSVYEGVHVSTRVQRPSNAIHGTVPAPDFDVLSPEEISADVRSSAPC